MLAPCLTVKSLFVQYTQFAEHRFSSISKDHEWCPKQSFTYGDPEDKCLRPRTYFSRVHPYKY